MAYKRAAAVAAKAIDNKAAELVSAVEEQLNAHEFPPDENDRLDFEQKLDHKLQDDTAHLATELGKIEGATPGLLVEARAILDNRTQQGRRAAKLNLRTVLRNAGKKYPTRPTRIRTMPHENSHRISELEQLQARLRGDKFRQSKTERMDVMGALAGFLADLGLHDTITRAGAIFAIDGLSAERYEATFHQVDMFVTSAITRLKSTPASANSAATGDSVFIGHGHSHVWRALKDFISDRLHLKCEDFNTISPAGIPTANRLEEMLNHSCFAFLVMTAEDQRRDGTLQPRMNVVHEAGLFQGRLGFKKAIVLLEEGCADFSNIDGLGHIPFPGDDIAKCFEEVRRVLEREGVVPGT
jgi:predicted nucleotide-binding protein